MSIDSRDDTFMTLLSESQSKAAREFAVAAATALATPRGDMHPGSVVAGTARMAGTYLFRSFGLSLPGVVPGQPVLSQAASELSPTLIQTAAECLAKAGIALDNTQAGKPVDNKHQPALAFLDTQRRLEPVFRPIQSRLGLSDREAAHAAAAAVAIVIQHCAAVMDTNTGFGIAALGFIEGAKTAPNPVQLAQDRL